MLEKDNLEEYAPVLALIATHLVSNPEWSLKLLDATTGQLLPPMYRQQRDTTADVLSALEAGREVVRRCPDSLADIEALAQLLARTERLEESLTWIDRAIVQEPNVASYHRLRASLLERCGQFEDAEAAINWACTLQPDILLN